MNKAIAGGGFGLERYFCLVTGMLLGAGLHRPTVKGWKARQLPSTVVFLLPLNSDAR